MKTLAILFAIAVASAPALAKADDDDVGWCRALPGASAATCDLYPPGPLADLHAAYISCVASGRERCEASMVMLMKLRRPEPLLRSAR